MAKGLIPARTDAQKEAVAEYKRCPGICGLFLKGDRHPCYHCLAVAHHRPDLARGLFAMYGEISKQIQGARKEARDTAWRALKLAEACAPLDHLILKEKIARMERDRRLAEEAIDHALMMQLLENAHKGRGPMTYPVASKSIPTPSSSIRAPSVASSVVSAGADDGAPLDWQSVRDFPVLGR